MVRLRTGSVGGTTSLPSGSSSSSEYGAIGETDNGSVDSAISGQDYQSNAIEALDRDIPSGNISDGLEEKLPAILIEERLLACFEAVEVMGKTLSDNPAITNPVKKKLLKNMACIRKELEGIDKHVFCLRALMDAFIEDFEKFEPHDADFADLVELIAIADGEIRTMITNLVPFSLSPTILARKLQDLKDKINAQATNHPHLIEQHEGLIDSALDTKGGYNLFGERVMKGIVSHIFPACYETVQRYSAGMKKTCCPQHKSAVLPRLRGLSRIAIGLWRMMMLYPPFPDPALKAKARMYAAQMQSILEPSNEKEIPSQPRSHSKGHDHAHSKSLSFNEVGALYTMLVPVTLVMRFKGIAIQRKDLFGPVFKVMRSVEVIHVRARSQIALRRYLNGGTVKVKPTEIFEPTREKTGSKPGSGPTLPPSSSPLPPRSMEPAEKAGGENDKENRPIMAGEGMGQSEGQVTSNMGKAFDEQMRKRGINPSNNKKKRRKVNGGKK